MECSDSDDKFTGTLVSKRGRVSLTTAPEYGKAYLTEAEKALLTKDKPEAFSKFESICGFTKNGDCSLLAAIMTKEDGLADYAAPGTLNPAADAPLGGFVQ